MRSRTKRRCIVLYGTGMMRIGGYNPRLVVYPLIDPDDDLLNHVVCEWIDVPGLENVHFNSMNQAQETLRRFKLGVPRSQKTDKRISVPGRACLAFSCPETDRLVSIRGQTKFRFLLKEHPARASACTPVLDDEDAGQVAVRDGGAVTPQSGAETMDDDDRLFDDEDACHDVLVEEAERDTAVDPPTWKDGDIVRRCFPSIDASTPALTVPGVVQAVDGEMLLVRLESGVLAWGDRRQHRLLRRE